MYEDEHVIELNDKPGWVQFKAHPEVHVELSTYQERLTKEQQALEQDTADLRRKVIRRVKTICRLRGYPHPDQGGLRVLSWNLIRLKQQGLAKAMPKAITNFTSDVYHWQHLINAVAFLTLKNADIDCEKQDLIISATEYTTSDRMLMLEARKKILKELDTQLDTIDIELPSATTVNKSLNARVEKLEESVNEILGILRNANTGTEARSVRTRKGRSK